MAPTLSSRVEEIGCMPNPSNPSVLADQRRTAWIIPVTVVGIIAIAITSIFPVFGRVKKKLLYRQAREKDPILSWREFSRRYKLTAFQQLKEDELQRSNAISKALASIKI